MELFFFAKRTNSKENAIFLDANIKIARTFEA